ncbi:hypothetical protein HDU98_001883 [Podochytrium sp. JEL0797]|nr:hypothetical protein HDU98_001883 [Podochytrium sp. JEL0797]
MESPAGRYPHGFVAYAPGQQTSPVRQRHSMSVVGYDTTWSDSSTLTAGDYDDDNEALIHVARKAKGAPLRKQVSFNALGPIVATSPPKTQTRRSSTTSIKSSLKKSRSTGALDDTPVAVLHAIQRDQARAALAASLVAPSHASIHSSHSIHSTLYAPSHPAPASRHVLPVSASPLPIPASIAAIPENTALVKQTPSPDTASKLKNPEPLQPHSLSKQPSLDTAHSKRSLWHRLFHKT